MKNYSKLLIITVFITISIFCFQSSAYAQVVLDGSMGTDAKLHGPDYDIKAGYGYQAGTNLFHSFHTFNINTNESATFSGPATVQNIISRVTGGTGSWIDGNLSSSIAGADLYLLNPAGVMFGANATLDISGSFHVSTADYLRLGGSERFFSVPTEGEVLSTASPAAFGFLDNDVASISFEGSLIQKEDWDGTPTGLSVSEGKTISVIGGDIEMSGSYYQELTGTSNGVLEDIQTGSLYAPEGRINIASVASKGEVVPTESGLDISSDNPGNIYADHALISVSGQGSGNIFARC
ncbi:MAG: filamentous hemagglutinin N-terminal domain-containing protein [Desulfobacteraceae bacterium]|nr:filamentous hemagglutinin N-terminal domain-containing protein [Desulfobacteraceae bacterium]